MDDSEYCKIFNTNNIMARRLLSDIEVGVPFIVWQDNFFSMSVVVDFLTNYTLSFLSKFGEMYVNITYERAQFLGLEIGNDFNSIRYFIDSLHTITDIKKIAGINASHDVFNKERFSVANLLDFKSLEILRFLKIAPSLLSVKLTVDDVNNLQNMYGMCKFNINIFQSYILELEKIRSVSKADIFIKYNNKIHQVKLYNFYFGCKEHQAIIIGDSKINNAPFVRIHSSCYTGDILKSVLCDCGDQLNHALEIMIENKKGGVIFYLNQEGRGIGLFNKLRTYKLQSLGRDTVEANNELGFRADERNFNILKPMFNYLGISQCQLITNNPIKKNVLNAMGVNVTQMIPSCFACNHYNSIYMETKIKKMGHCCSNYFDCEVG